MRLWRLVAISVLVGVCVACTASPTAPGVAVTSAEAAPPVSTQKSITTSSIPDFISSGPIIVENQVDVAAQRDGIVAAVLAEPGRVVKKGELLAKLDDRQISAELEAARAKTRSTENDLRNWEAEARVLDADYARAQKMWEAHIIPFEQLEHARYKAESDQWDVKRVRELLTNAREVERSLELELEKTQISAPFAGVVARRYVRVGQSVVRNDRLFWVTATAPLHIRVTLPERFLGRIKTGATLAVTAAEEPQNSRSFKARVIQVSPVVDPASDTIEVLAELYGNTTGLRPGMRADLHVPNLP